MSDSRVIEQMEADHREHVAALIRQSNFREAGLHTALRTETEKVERLEAQLVGAVETERARIVALMRREAEQWDDVGGVLGRLADHIAAGGQ